MTASHLLGLACIRCGTSTADAHLFTGCPLCAARNEHSNLTTVYDLERARPAFAPEALAQRAPGLWRYDTLLPFAAEAAVTLNEGGTALVPAPRLARHLGLRRLWIKDESRNPTWSFKDRSASVGATHAVALNAPAMVVSSTGNAAAATAAYARRAGLPCIVLVTKNVEAIMGAFVRAYGALVVATETKSDRWRLMQHCVEAWGCYPAGGFRNPPIGGNPYMTDGYKSIGFELWEQLGRRQPDWVFGPTGYTNAMYGIFKAFNELKEMGLVSSGPRLAVAEAYGSLSKAIAEGANVVSAMPAEPTTIAFSMGTAQNAYHGLVTVRASNGLATHVHNDAILAAQRLLADQEGLFGETASATGLAALVQRLDEGLVERNAEVVVLYTSSGLKSLGVTADLNERAPLAADLSAFERVLREQYGFTPLGA
jgi:threonine synthase